MLRRLRDSIRGVRDSLDLDHDRTPEGSAIWFLLVLMSASTLASVAALVVSLVVFSGRVDQATERSNLNSALIVAIQQSRQGASYDACVVLNERSDATLGSLSHLARRPDPATEQLLLADRALVFLVAHGPEVRLHPVAARNLIVHLAMYGHLLVSQKPEQVKAFAVLLRAIVPHRNCAAVALQQTSLRRRPKPSVPRGPTGPQPPPIIEP